MKKVNTILAASILIIAPTLACASAIEFDIAGVKSDSGKVYVQLFKGEQNYKSGKVESAQIVNAKTGEIKVVFNDIAAGEYALRFFHDENDNGKLETNLFGMPVEGYGFSNNAVPNFGPVSYSEIKFLVSENQDKVVNKTSAIY